MYDQLKHLEQIILDVKKQHHLVSNELNILKQNPTIDPKELVIFKTKLENSYAERDNRQKQFDELDARYQDLAEAHHIMGTEQKSQQKQLLELQQQNSELLQQVNTLKKQNNDLHQKNLLAAERTMVVSNRLAMIDQTNT